MNLQGDQVIKVSGMLKGDGLEGKVWSNFGDKGLDNNATDDSKGKSLGRRRKGKI